MVSADLATRVAERLYARPVEDVPHWRARLGKLWRHQVEKITELSLAFHETAPAVRASDQADLADPGTRELRRIVADTASARHALTEIESAMGRIDTGSYGICDHCGLPLPSRLLNACPQAR